MFLTALLLACASPSSSWTAGVDHFDAARVWYEVKGYAKAWEQEDPWIGYQSSRYHGPLVRIWINHRAYGRVGGTIPNGGTLVVESFEEEGGERTGLGVMRKTEGYDKDGNHWFWGSYDTSGAVDEAGRLGDCQFCHQMGADYVRSANGVPDAGDDDTGDTGP